MTELNISDIINEVEVNDDDVLAVQTALQNEGLADAGFDLIGEGVKLADCVQLYGSILNANRENLPALIAIIVRAVWGNDALRMLNSLPPANRGAENHNIHIKY